MNTGVALAVAMDAGYKPFGDAQAAIEMVDDPYLDRRALRVQIDMYRSGTFGTRSPVEGKVLEPRGNGNGLPEGAPQGVWLKTDEDDDVNNTTTTPAQTKAALDDFVGHAHDRALHVVGVEDPGGLFEFHRSRPRKVPGRCPGGREGAIARKRIPVAIRRTGSTRRRGTPPSGPHGIRLKASVLKIVGAAAADP